MSRFAPRVSATIALILVLAVAWSGPAPAQEASRQELALELARIMLDATARQRLDEQVTGAVMRAIAGMLQERLNRPLQESEWRLLQGLAARFVGDTLSSTRVEELAAGVYASHFDDAELRDLLRFQHSAVAQKATRLRSVIDVQTARAIDAELRDSPGMPGLREGLARAFPVSSSRSRHKGTWREPTPPPSDPPNASPTRTSCGDGREPSIDSICGWSSQAQRCHRYAARGHRLIQLRS